MIFVLQKTMSGKCQFFSIFFPVCENKVLYLKMINYVILTQVHVIKKLTERHLYEQLRVLPVIFTVSI